MVAHFEINWLSSYAERNGRQYNEHKNAKRRDERNERKKNDEIWHRRLWIVTAKLHITCEMCTLGFFHGQGERKRERGLGIVCCAACKLCLDYNVFHELNSIFLAFACNCVHRRSNVCPFSPILSHTTKTVKSKQITELILISFRMPFMWHSWDLTLKTNCTAQKQKEKRPQQKHQLELENSRQTYDD